MYDKQVERAETIWDYPEDVGCYATQQLDQLRAAESRLRGVARVILRGFSRGVPDPNIVSAIQLQDEVRPNAVVNVQRVFRQLRAFIFERLLTTPMEEEERHQYLREITIRDRKNSEMIDRLESELRIAQGEKVRGGKVYWLLFERK